METEKDQMLQVQKGADIIQPSAAGNKNYISDGKDGSDEKDEANKKRGGINKSLRR